MPNAILELNLEPIKVKLMHVESGEGWSLARVNFVEGEYRRFLELAKRFPDEEVACSKDVDIFWHYHILDTRKYAQDCEQIFGYFLHHFPYIGLGSEDDQQQRIDSTTRMHAMYAATFGETCPSLTLPTAKGNAGAKSSDVAYCAVATQTTDAAYCAVATKPTDAAYCAVATKPTDAAYCAVATKPTDAAYCAVATKSTDAAYCAVATKPTDAAYCAVATKSGVAVHSNL